MTTPRAGLAILQGCTRTRRIQWQSLEKGFQALSITPARTTIRALSTQSNPMNPADAASKGMAVIMHARPLPVSPSYFTLSARFNDDFIKIQNLYRRFQHVPHAPPDKVPRVAWRKFQDYRAFCGEAVRASHYSECIAMAKHLHKIHPDLKSEEVMQALHPFKRDINAHGNAVRTIPIDKFGRALGTGRRKTSVARAWVVEGSGEIIINGKSLAEAFGRVHDRESAIWALRASQRLDKYNVWALVEGGGPTGQAEAMTLAVAKALMAHEPALKPALRRAGCVTRDPRMVERKKPGHVKARKMPAWVKR
ncbi:hypothetical protein MCOR25_008738 [Pyricularia grisea]|uniref:Small ribosomal subunit protein uS9m n=1 Tax=Pyricularia grisea TaxID=148305 RepID=A0A6P8B6K2_PYRGI|nr:hypothetical protein PgNI_06018 [Pyricularia grisea]KAI6354120.1 hypothetical protein MCOR25_008738 [Pyricularia grisea]TLD10951.1 hypothetical protein PgNI_06018 [Pyricularia grisea]